MFKVENWNQESRIISSVLERAPVFDKEYRVPKDEFLARQKKVIDALADLDIDCGLVYSDEHYNGDVPYLGGNTNISIEPVAGVIGKNGFHILAGLEGGYIAEQLSARSGCKVFKVEMLKLADENYPINATRIEDVIEMVVGGKPTRIGLLTPKEVLPVSIYKFLSKYLGHEENIIDIQEAYYHIKYEKSINEMRLIEEASKAADVMLEGMLAVLRPGMYETQVAKWGYAIAYELGIEEMGFDIMVTSNEANRTLIGKALNRKINEGDVVHIGVGPKRDGLTACERVSVVCVKNETDVPKRLKYWFEILENAFLVGLNEYINVAKKGLPAYLQEQALVDFFESKSSEISNRLNKMIDFTRQKPYTGTHNAGYTECQEFYGAITLNSKKPLGNRIVTMLDVAIKGIGDNWDDVVIPDFDYLVIEKTLGKENTDVKVLNRLPLNVQYLVGQNF